MREFADETEIRPTAAAPRCGWSCIARRIALGQLDDEDECGVSEPIDALPKPDALLALHDVTAELFDTLRYWFDVPASVSIDLRAVDSAVGELGDPQMIAALAMRKLQALNLLATPGVLTTTDVVVAIVQDLDRALVQAPEHAPQARGRDDGLGRGPGRARAPTCRRKTWPRATRSDVMTPIPRSSGSASCTAVCTRRSTPSIEASEGEIRYFV